MDPLRGMQTFHSVVAGGSFSAAARELGIAKSAVSRQVKQLEGELGARLLNRSTRRLSLTEAGEHYFASCARILAEADEAKRRVAKLQDRPVGRLRVATEIGFGVIHLIPALAEFKRRYPEMNFDVLLEDFELDLAKEGIDLAVRFGSMRDSTYIARRVASMDWVVCATPEYLDEHGVPEVPADLARHEYLMFKGGWDFTRWNFRRGAERFPVRVSGGFSSNNMLAVHAALRAGLGIGAFSRNDLAEDLASGRVLEVLPDYTLAPIGVYLVYPPGHHELPKVRFAVDFLAGRWASLG